jgi:hypothetical protein
MRTEQPVRSRTNNTLNKVVLLSLWCGYCATASISGVARLVPERESRCLHILLPTARTTIVNVCCVTLHIAFSLGTNVRKT